MAVKGIGLWTAQMFLMFQLERPDVLPVGDLGIRRAMELAYGLRDCPPCRDGGDRRALASAPDARLPLPVALAPERARIGPAPRPARNRAGAAREGRPPAPLARLSGASGSLNPRRCCRAGLYG